ncbi:PilT/PilU family type 4a pilus ATPase [Patescibacteria group bacterium]|nr:PilT/PilU family type 4a pilus ATPase [Patescibacteria group bacterium]MBU1124225.1 PilT/PilU family type 4a pilus ATPase [Patescibacteria group bacterium]MBU1911504.1 PilT/PilU family type 4a pilus ATPase [Patescibacteria group bacterium]
MPISPETTFTDAAAAGASDVHVVVGSPLIFRKDGELIPQGDSKLTKEDAEEFVKGVLGAEQFKRLQEDLEIDSSYELKDGVRLRVNCHHEKGNISLVARIIPTSIPTLDDIGFTDHMKSLCGLKSGLILFTGPTGSGKSTTMASMIQHINNERAENIVTLEDPIEFIFPEGKGIIRQRQFREDFHSFAEALRRVLRQDPNIVMVGEMRDHETIAAALTLAETGHLILATLHTPNAIQSVDRIIDVFPAHQQQQVRTQLSLSLKAILAQRLLPKEGGGRVAQRECMINTPAVANIIRDNRVQELTSVLQSGKDEGMCPFERDAKRLLDEGLISEEVAEGMGS